MKNFKNQFCALFAAVAVFIGTVMSNGACLFDYYQPKIPEKMRK